MASELVAMAALNNALQSEAVLAAVGSSGAFGEVFWQNDHRFDIPYANGATLGSAADGARHLEAIKRLTAAREPDVPTYVMDSWATLDLEPLGYRVRFADEWFVSELPPQPSGPPLASIEVIDNAARLVEWEAASVIAFGGGAPETRGHTYPPGLLADERFTFYGVDVDGALAAGVLLFRDPACTGVYTFFTLPEYRGRGLGTALLRHALNHAPDPPLATNPSEMSRGIFSKLGFRAVGERRVWAR